MSGITLTAAIKNYFEIATSRELIDEFKKLTPNDKADLVTCFSAVGIKVERPVTHSEGGCTCAQPDCKMCTLVTSA